MLQRDPEKVKRKSDDPVIRKRTKLRVSQNAHHYIL